MEIDGCVLVAIAVLPWLVYAYMNAMQMQRQTFYLKSFDSATNAIIKSLNLALVASAPHPGRPRNAAPPEERAAPPEERARPPDEPW